MITGMTGFRWFSKCFASCALDESNLNIGKVNPFTSGDYRWSDIYENTLEYLEKYQAES